MALEDYSGSAAADLGHVRWLREWSLGGEVSLRVGRSPEELVADWRGVGVLRSTRCGSTNSFSLHEGAEHDDPRIAKFHRGTVQAYLRHLEGKMTLHASCVVLNGRCLAFLGDSGAGKSTIAAALCLGHHAMLLGDDTLPLELRSDGFHALPSEESHWLNEDAALRFGVDPCCGWKTEKRAERGAPPARLSAIVALTFDEAARVAQLGRVKGREAFAAVASQVFRFVLDEPAVDLHDFEQVSELCRALPIYRLRRRPSLDDLDASVHLLLETFGGRVGA